MKWFGIELNNGVAEFDDDIYFNNLTTTSETSVLVVDSAGLVSKSTSLAGDITGITAGDGLTGTDLTGPVPTLSADLKSNGGLVIESAEIAVDLGASSVTGTLAVADGGTNNTALSNKSICYTQDSGTDKIRALVMNGNGEIVVGGTSGPSKESAADLAGTGLSATTGDGTLSLNVEATQPDIDSIGTDGDTLNILGDNLTMANSTASKPLITIDNSSTAQQDGGGFLFKLADTNTFLGDGLTVGQITASAYDITDEDYLPIAQMRFDTLGTGSNNDIPGIIKFAATNGNGTLLDAMAIYHGQVDIGNLTVGQKLIAGQVCDFTPTFLVVSDCDVAATLSNRREYMVNDADGGALVLPTAAEGYRIIINIGTTITSNTITITAASGDLLKGYAFMERTDAANNKTYFAPDGTNDLIITLNGSTKGGLVGDKIELVGISGTEWRVRATLSHTGSAVNPFS